MQQPITEVNTILNSIYYYFNNIINTIDNIIEKIEKKEDNISLILEEIDQDELPGPYDEVYYNQWASSSGYDGYDGYDN